MLNNFLGRRDFVLACSGKAMSAFGDEMALVALTLRLQTHGGHPYQVAALLAAGLVPVVVLSGWAGTLVDRHNSRTLLVAASSVAAGCCSALVFVTQPALMLVLVAALGVGTAVVQPTWQALLPRIAGEDQLGRAIGLQQMATGVAMIAAPAASGLLVGAFGTRLPVAVDAATFGIMIAAAAMIRTRRATAPAARQPESGGWSVIRTDPVLAVLTGGVCTFVLICMMVNIVEVFLVRSTLHAGSAWYGALMAVWMVGMIGGNLAATRVTRDDRRLRVAFGGALVLCAALAGYGLVPDVGALVPLALLGGAGNGVLTSCTSATIMTRSPEHVRGRVSATVNALMSGAALTSLLCGGLAATVLSPRTIMIGAGGLGLLTTAVIGQRWRARDLSRGPGPLADGHVGGQYGDVIEGVVARGHLLQEPVAQPGQ
jgi:MFS family permease